MRLRTWSTWAQDKGRNHVS